MANEEEDSSTEFTHSDALFVNESGECMRFYIRPCREKGRIRKLIEHGGGILSAWAEASIIRLHVDGDPCYSDGYYKSTFIDDCVKENSLMDLEDYEVENEKTKEKSTNHVIRKFPRLRNPYTEEEDSDILMYVAERPTYLNGNSIWKSMEKAKVTDHPWQSMRSRFHHQLKDRLPEFIEIVRKQKVNNGDSSFENCEDISCDEKDKTNDTEEDNDIKKPSTSKNRLVILDTESETEDWISVSQQTRSTTTSHEPNSSPPDRNEENTEDDDDASMVTAVEELNTPSSTKRKLFNFYKSKKTISQRLRNRIENVSNIQPNDNNADKGSMVTDEIRTPSSAKRKKLSFKINTVEESAKCISQRTRSQNKDKSPNQSHGSRCKNDIVTNEDVENNLVPVNNNNSNGVNGQNPQRKTKVGWRKSDEGENDLDSEEEMVDGQEISDADSGTELGQTKGSEVREGQLDEESDEEGSDTGRGTEEDDLNEDTLQKIMTDAEFYMEIHGLTEAEIMCVYQKHKFKTDEVGTWFESFEKSSGQS